MVFSQLIPTSLNYILFLLLNFVPKFGFTERIKKDLESLAKKGVILEGLTCILLRLSLSDRGFVEMALNLIKSCDLLNNLLIMNMQQGECRRL